MARNSGYRYLLDVYSICCLINCTMLAKSLVEEIDRLLHEGRLSQRKIAAQLRVSRGTVSAIASGRRGVHGREVDDEERYLHHRQSGAERCPRCGYLVYMPCLICLNREFH